MNIEDFSWKAPLSDAWDSWYREAKDIFSIVATDPSGAASHGPRLAELLFRMGTCRLTTMEQLRLEKLLISAWPLRTHLAPFRTVRIGLTGSKTLDFIAGPLRAAGLAHLLLIEPVIAPLNSAAAIAHGALNPFGELPLDAIVLWQDMNEYRGTGKLLDQDDEKKSLDAAMNSLLKLAHGLNERFGTRIIIPSLIPDRRYHLGSADLSTPGTESRFVAKFNSMLSSEPSVHCWEMWDVASLAANIGISRWFDPQRFFEFKTPFAFEFNSLVCDHLARFLSARMGKARRALVLDLDNTLWDGVIGDDGLEGIKIGQGSALGEAFLAMQTTALELRRRGIALCVCSKNNEDLARLPFQQHPDMLLREKHIAVFQANWNDKATNLRAIAKTLRLGFESLVFVDDNPAERARVRQELPFVAVIELDDNPSNYPDLVISSGFFEHAVLTNDDLGRADSYQSDSKREQVLASAENYEDYLRSLKMTMHLSSFDNVGLPRIAQLISKSNQFNVTSRRHDTEFLSKISVDTDFICWQVRLTDVFSEHGMIAVIIIKKINDDWIIDTWLQSCRILERGVEHTLANLIMEAAAAAGVSRVYGEYIPSARNEMVRNLFIRLGFQKGEPPLCITEYADGTVWFFVNPAEFSAHFSAIEVIKNDIS